MEEALIDTVVDVGTGVFVLSTMLAMGLTLSTDQLLAAVGKRRLMTKSLLVNLVAVPLLAYLLVRMLPLEPAYAAGILLISVAPGAPFGPKLAELSNSDLAFASGLMAVLGVVSVVTIPVTLALLLPESVVVDPLAIGGIVLGIQLVPLLVGLAVTSHYPRLANSLYPPVQRVSDYSFFSLLVLLLLVYFEDMIGLFGTGTLLVSIGIVAASLLLGYVLGGPARTRREVLATTTAARNAAIALFIATTSFSDPNVLTIVLAFSFIGVVGSAGLARMWGRRTSR
ncbi:bile acid:sodium symporter family protein [Natronococcus occultus]|uniref:Putative Na+-dependent transporter n=1 Tax=Natronococcus occultus SP4 TaxID=694430 RepID=L0K730_9EURY|nr:Na+-dependent transporter [Natronococcus occultus]AGB39933.1 putative Na+-dependent transporter [Natronococcus occultus SP4]